MIKDNLQYGQCIEVTKDSGIVINAKYGGIEERFGSRWLRMNLDNGNIHVLREDRIALIKG